MRSSLAPSERERLINSVGKATCAKAKLSINEVERAAQIIRRAIDRSGIQKKTLGDDKGRISRLLDGTAADRLWFHEMLATWPAEVWCELLPLIALEVCKGQFTVKRAVTIEEKSA